MSRHLPLPAGTKVLTRADGRVGVVAGVPKEREGRYRIRFPEGTVEEFLRGELTIYKLTAGEIPGAPASGDFLPYVIYRCVVGSRAYGLDHEGSDVDRRGIYLPPAELHWSLAGVPEQIETPHEECYWEIEKFLRLALKANPNILECLYSPLVEAASPLAQELLAMRRIFLSKYVHCTYNAYVLSQFKKIERDLRSEQGVRWKHVMHLLRLLLSGIVVLREGFVPLRVDLHKDRLLSIRRGEASWESVERWRLDLHKELDLALDSTGLPEHPDYAQANEFLLRARRYATLAEHPQC